MLSPRIKADGFWPTIGRPMTKAWASPSGLGRPFVGQHPSALILGDNIFYGGGLRPALEQASGQVTGATVFAYYVSDPERYGVVSFDGSGRAETIEEKPRQPKSRYAVTGLYFYDTDVLDIAARVARSRGGETALRSSRLVDEPQIIQGELR